MDCSWDYGNNGCDGGEEWRSYQYVMDKGGLMTEEDYGPYMGQVIMRDDQDDIIHRRWE